MNWRLAVGFWLLAFAVNSQNSQIVLSEHSHSVNALAFSADNRLLVSGGNDDRIILWSIDDNFRSIAEFEHAKVTALDFRSNGDFVSASENGTIRFWSAIDQRQIDFFRPQRGAILSCRFSPNGKFIAFGTSEGDLHIWDFYTQSYIWHSSKNQQIVWSVAFSPDGTQIASAGEDRTIHLWNAETGDLINTFFGHTQRIWQIAFSADGDRIFSASWDGSVRQCDLKTGDSSEIFAGDLPNFSVAISPNDQIIAVGNSRNSLQFLKTTDFSTIREFDQIASQTMRFSSDGAFFASSGSDNGDIWIWRSSAKVPRLISPSNGDRVSRSEAELIWTEDPEAIYFDLEISTTGFENGNIVSRSLTTNRVPILIGHDFHSPSPEEISLPLSENYWWRVRSVGFGDLSEWSERFQIRTDYKPPPTCEVWVVPQIRRVDLNSEFPISIWIEAVDDLVGFQFDLRWSDPDRVKFVTTTGFNKIFPSITQPSSDLPFFQLDAENGIYKNVVATKIGDEGVSGGGMLLSLLLRADQIGTYEIGLENLILLNSDQQTIDCQIHSAIISVEDPAHPWDINDDQRVDIFDLSLVARYFGKPLLFEIEVNPDVNGDGKIDLFDFTLVAIHFGENYAIRSAPIRNQNQNQLLANFPNPFNPETWIPFEISENSEVKIEIYSAKGDLIKILDLGFVEMGIYRSRSRSAFWDGKNENGESVSSGVYFYRLITADHSEIRKMVISK